jgi:hypothetical protein
MIRILGVDPGLSGAVATLDLHQGGELPVLIAVSPTPTLTVTTRTKTRREYDVPAMWRLLVAARAPAQVRIAGVFVERQGPRPHQGVTSTFSTGVGFGLWRGLVIATALPLVVVEPLMWRRAFGLVGKGKAAALRVATERFPAEFPPQLRRYDGAADAVLIALFGWLQRRADRVSPDESQRPVLPEGGNTSEQPLGVPDRGLEGRVDPGARN